MDTCLTVTLLHDYCTQRYINLHKLFILYCNFICVLSVVIIKIDDDDDDDAYIMRGESIKADIFTILIHLLLILWSMLGLRNMDNDYRNSNLTAIFLQCEEIIEISFQ